MDRWPYGLPTITQTEITEYCVNDSTWQKFRLTLKGLPTTRKLTMLDSWAGLLPARRAVVQTTNYINALKRGGQLNMELRVVR